MDVILCLPSLPTLQFLSFTLSANSGVHTTHRGPPITLSNLTDLAIESPSLKSIATLVSRIRLPIIKDLSVTVSEYTPRRDVQEYWTILQKACPSNTLTHLVFSSSGDDTIGISTSANEQCTLDDLLPYKDFGNLRWIEFNAAWSMNLTDDDLLVLISTSPQLETLSINRSCGWGLDGDGGITLNGLVQVLRQCPSLCGACLVIDARTFSQIPHGLDLSFLSQRAFEGTLVLDCLDTYFPFENDPGMKSVVTKLGLHIWSSFNGEINYDGTQDAGDE